MSVVVLRLDHVTHAMHITPPCNHGVPSPIQRNPGDTEHQSFNLVHGLEIKKKIPFSYVFIDWPHYSVAHEQSQTIMQFLTKKMEMQPYCNLWRLCWKKIAGAICYVYKLNKVYITNCSHWGFNTSTFTARPSSVLVRPRAGSLIG